MPRYRVVLEFDHPGDGVVIGPGKDTTRSPEHWSWGRILCDVSNVEATVFEAEVAWTPLSKAEGK